MPTGNIYVALLICIGLMLILLTVGVVVAVRTARIKPRSLPSPRRPSYDQEAVARVTEALSNLIRFQTVSNPGSAQGDSEAFLNMWRYLQNRYPLCHEHLECEQVNSFSLLYRWVSPDPKGDPIMLCAHMDCAVAAGTWKHPPFAGKVEGGFVWGRGALSGKANLTCVLEVIESLLSTKAQVGRDVYLAFGHDKEMGGVQGAGQIAQLLASRGIRFSMILDEGNPISDSALPISCPVIEVGVAEKGNINVRLSAIGECGSSAEPPEHTSLSFISEALCRVAFRAQKARLSPVIKDTLKGLAPWLPYKSRMLITNLWLFRRAFLKKLRQNSRTAPLVCSTVAAVMSSCGHSPGVLPPIAEAILNIRVLPGDNERILMVWLDALIADLPMKTEVLFSANPSKVSDYHGEEYQMLTASLCDAFDTLPVIPILQCAGSDAKYYEPLCSCVFRMSPFIVAPGDRKGICGNNERVSVPSLGAGVQFYRSFIERAALVKAPPGDA
ncbi:MAG: M20/M25/M40 family metallo-hydrolase [Oscillospiraceae bacterium]|nr:M20/M25/M40 family metallo-hydrolase [Oscillospiraceae bacterium]